MKLAVQTCYKKSLFKLSVTGPTTAMKITISSIITLIWTASEIHCSKQPRLKWQPLQRCHLFLGCLLQWISDDPRYYNRSMCPDPYMDSMLNWKKTCVRTGWCEIPLKMHITILTQCDRIHGMSWSRFQSVWNIGGHGDLLWNSKGIQMRNTLRLKIRIFDLDGLRCFESKNF